MARLLQFLTSQHPQIATECMRMCVCGIFLNFIVDQFFFIILFYTVLFRNFYPFIRVHLVPHFYHQATVSWLCTKWRKIFITVIDVTSRVIRHRRIIDQVASRSTPRAYETQTRCTWLEIFFWFLAFRFHSRIFSTNLVGSVACLSPYRIVFDPTPDHVRCAAKWQWDNINYYFGGVSPVSIVTAMPHTPFLHSFIRYWCCMAIKRHLFTCTTSYSLSETLVLTFHWLVSNQLGAGLILSLWN